MGTTGGTNEDLIEANELAAKASSIPPSWSLTSAASTASPRRPANLPNIKGGKKLAYTQFEMPLTAIEDFGKPDRRDPFFKKLDECCKAHKGLWNPEAERMIFEHFGVEVGI